MVSALISSLYNDTDININNQSSYSRADLDSHANMVVLGKYCYVYSKTGKTCTVYAFTPGIEPRTIPVVDAIIMYDDPHTLLTYPLIVKNALYVPEMDHHLIPPFILREAGVRVNDVPKVQIADPGIDDHTLYFQEKDLRIHLQLHGIFSYFRTRAPTSTEIDDFHEDNALLITPDSNEWDPSPSHYAEMEESMIDSDGNMVDRERRVNFLLPEDTDQDNDDGYISFCSADTVEKAIDFVHDQREPSTPVSPSVPSDELTALQNLVSKAAEAHISSLSGISDDSIDSGTPFFTTVDEMEAALGAEVAEVLAQRPQGVSKEFLAKIWEIDESVAQQVLDTTTQVAPATSSESLSRRRPTNDRSLRYKRLKSMFFTDTFFVSKKAITKKGFTMMQIFVSDKGFIAVYPMKAKSQFQDCLKLFCKEVGIPHTLVVDKSGEQTSQAVKKFTQQVGTTLRVLEESTQWANRAELYVGLMKEWVRKDLRNSDAPLCLWDYCARRRALINNLTPKNMFQCEGNNPFEATFGEQGDISKLQFGWYEWCYYREQSNIQFPYQKELLGRVLCPTKHESNHMAQNVLNEQGNVVPRRTLRRLTEAELHSETERLKRKKFDQTIKEKLGDSLTAPSETTQSKLGIKSFIDEDADCIRDEDFWKDGDPVGIDDMFIHENPALDSLIGAELNLPQQHEMRRAKVLRRSRNSEGEHVGNFHENPLLNSTVYDVEFLDGEVQQVGANITAQHMFEQVDDDGYTHSVVDTILDYRTDGTEVQSTSQFLRTKSGQLRQRKSTVGWELYVQMKDGTKDWIPLSILKESNPIEVAEFATSRQIEKEPAFSYWVPHVLKTRNAIISKVNARIPRVTHKYGIEVPRSVEHAYELDKANKNDYWATAIKKEMDTVLVAFQILAKGEKPPVGYTKSSGHVVFDVKMDFTRKARWVKDGHKHGPPPLSTFAGVVSRESVRILLTYAALNDVDVMAFDIKGAYLQAPTSEKHFVICGPEFGEYENHYAVIKRALYGGKSAGADYWRHMRDCMEALGFKSSLSDPDVWMRKAQKANGEHYYEYVCLYTDDCLVISENPEPIIRRQIGKYWPIKEDSIGPPDIYLGNVVTKVRLDNDVVCWAFSSSKYTQAAIANVEKRLQTKGLKLQKRAAAPLREGYRPELDTTPILEQTEASYYMSLIGILRWIVELGRVDITTEVSMMASMIAQPREGHLEQLYHIFAFLKIKHNAEMVFDPTPPDIPDNEFEKHDWSHTVYGNVKEELPDETHPEYREPRGIGFVIRAYVDSDHAADTVTRRSRTGFIVFLNNAPIYWYSKRQTGIETSTFGSEFIAMKHCCEYLRGLRFKLRSFGIPVDMPCLIYGDNKSVLVNSSVPDSVLRKKSNSIAYHFVREGSAKDEWRHAYIPTADNLADMLTKPTYGMKRQKFTGMVLHHVYR